MGLGGAYTGFARRSWWPCMRHLLPMLTTTHEQGTLHAYLPQSVEALSGLPQQSTNDSHRHGIIRMLGSLQLCMLPPQRQQLRECYDGCLSHPTSHIAPACKMRWVAPVA